MKKKAGFVGIIGRPNVGKSTLLNFIVGEKLAAVSPKPQTTRGVVRGIVTQKEGQIVFLDTPGHYKPQDRLGEWMMTEIRKTIESADLLYWLVKPELPGIEEEKILELLRAANLPVILTINQIDKVQKPDVLPVIAQYQTLYAFKDIIPVSAKTGEQIPLLIQKSFEYLPEGEAYFPEDQISDQQEKFFVQEIIREKIFKHTQQEIPYATTIVVEKYQERKDKLVEISATIMVDKTSQKAIVIGKNGAMLKLIGTDARKDIERFVGQKVYLQLWVKVMEDWKRNDQLLKKLGYQ